MNRIFNVDSNRSIINTNYEDLEVPKVITLLNIHGHVNKNASSYTLQVCVLNKSHTFCSGTMICGTNGTTFRSSFALYLHVKTHTYMKKALCASVRPRALALLYLSV